MPEPIPFGKSFDILVNYLFMIFNLLILSRSTAFPIDNWNKNTSHVSIEKASAKARPR